MSSPQDVIVLFDGECLACSRSVEFLARHDASGRLRFAALGSPAGVRVLEARGLPGDFRGSMVVVDGQHVYTHSDAALHVAGLLRRPWRWGRALAIVPKLLRDAAYNLVARNRYLIAGKAKPGACPQPSPQLRERLYTA